MIGHGSAAPHKILTIKFEMRCFDAPLPSPYIQYIDQITTLSILSSISLFISSFNLSTSSRKDLAENLKYGEASSSGTELIWRIFLSMFPLS